MFRQCNNIFIKLVIFNMIRKKFFNLKFDLILRRIVNNYDGRVKIVILVL